MKFFKTIAVVSLLFILPGASWYFLQSGLNWRVDKRELLEPKISIEELLIDKSYQSTYKDKTTLVILNSRDIEKEQVIKDQFRKAYTFQWKQLDAEQFSDHMLIRGNDYMLIDTGLMVRRFYTGAHDSIYAHIVEDITLIMPRKKELDIKMKENRKDE